MTVSVYKANLELDRVRLQSYVYKRRQKIFKYTHSAEPNHRGFFRIYPPGGTVLPTTACVSDIEFKPSVIHFLFRSEQYHSCIIPPFPLSFSLSLILILLRSLFLLLHCLQINILPRPNEYFLLTGRKSPFTFCYIFAAIGSGR